MPVRNNGPGGYSRVSTTRKSKIEPEYPQWAESKMRAIENRRLKELQAVVRDSMPEILAIAADEMDTASESIRKDGYSDMVRRIQNRFRIMRDRLSRRLKTDPLERDVRRCADYTDRRQLQEWQRSVRATLGIKLDVQGAYAHTKQAIVMDILRREIPGATWLLAVINCLLAMAPGEGLLIGGYLEAWLFNLVASYMLVKVLSYAKTRRGASTPFVTRSGSYMDDLVLLGRRWADIQSAARKLTKWALAELGLTIKTEWVRVDFLSATEEHQRRHLTGAAKGCPGLDMAGYVMHRTYTTIRPRIFLRARRQYLRAKEDVVRQGYIPVWRSYKLVSYNGYFDWTKSRAVMETLKQQKLFKAAKLSVRVTAQRRALKERLAA